MKKHIALTCKWNFVEHELPLQLVVSFHIAKYGIPVGSLYFTIVH